MKRILFVSISFPPKADPEGLQTAKYFHHLQRYDDLKIDVVTSAIPTLYMPYDPDLEPYAVGADQLISVRLRENRYINFLRDRLQLSHTAFPDVKQSFHRQARKVLKQLRNKPDLIYSRADPKSSTIMAYKLKQALQVPWILHMSDPWADCPLENRKGKWYRTHDAWERKCLEAADIISVTSEATLLFYRKKYPAYSDKFRLFPNVFEYGAAAPAPEKEVRQGDRKFRMVYTGGLAYDRSPEYLLKALRELVAADPALAGQLEVIFAGDADARNRAVFQQYNLPFVKWLGKLPFQQALQLQRTADYLMLIDSPIADPSMAMFFPSKLLDYMVARKRILAITTPGSSTWQVMQDLNGDLCTHDDITAIAQTILRAFNKFKAGEATYLENARPPEKYEAAYNAARLHEEINKLLNVQ